MSKTQTILGLLLFLFILFSVDIQFGHSLKLFSNQDALRGIELNNVINLLDDNVIEPNKLNRNVIYSGNGLLEDTIPYPKGDDQPLFFGFSF